MNTARILIVEESSVLRQLALNLVEELGLIGQTAIDLDQAAMRLAAKEFDIVLVEVKAPEETALARIKSLRLMAEKSSRTKPPIVAMSTGVKRGPLLTAGASDILMRPFMAGELEAVVDRWLSR